MNPDDAWMADLASYATVRSGGEWRPWGYLEHIADRICEAIYQGNARVIVNMPPRHGKSELGSQWLPKWFLDYFMPDGNVALTSYGDDVAREWSENIRDYFGSRVVPGKNAASRWRLSTGGGCVSTGVGGALTGRGAHLLITDDPHKNWEDAQSPAKLSRLRNWLKTVARTRLEPGGSWIVIHTRWSEQDCTAMLLEEMADEDWQVLTIPALASVGDPLGRLVGSALSPRYPLDQLHALRRSLGPTRFAAMFQQDTAGGGSGVWRREWIQTHRYTARDAQAGLFDRLFMSIDPNLEETLKGSYAVIQVWGTIGPNRFLLDQSRGRWSFVQMIQACDVLMARWPWAREKLVENKANGAAMMDLMRRRGVTGFVPVHPRSSKVSRALTCQGEFEEGRIFVPELAPWVTELVREWSTFPRSANDDQVDCASQAIMYSRAGTPIMIGRLEV